MQQALKELIVVFVLTAPVWVFSKRLFAPFAAPGVWERRRNLWIYLTALGLLSPSIWLYAAFAAVPIYRIGRRDPNPVALYVLLCFVIPNITAPLPAVIVNELFDISNQRILAFALVVPALMRARRARISSVQDGGSIQKHRFDAMDGWLCAYIVLTILALIPYESFTNTLRRGTLAFLDIVILFIFWSRLTARQELMRDCLAMWVLSAMLMSVLAVFETARGWLLYAPIADRWGNPNDFAFLLRGGLLRAQVSTGHSLTLGIWLATGWAFFLFVQTLWKGKLDRWLVGATILAGLGASMARGAWIAATLATLVFFLLNPKGIGAAVKAISGMIVLFGLFLLTPFSDRFVRLLPFVGTMETENVDYRKRLLERSIELIQDNPWFGDPFVVRHMESLRQGQGIIDIVNGYLVIALFNGIVGLFLFLSFLLLGYRRGVIAWRRAGRTDPEAVYLGAALLAAMSGTMLFIATAGIDPMTYMLAGLLSGYWWMRVRARPV